MPQEEREKPVCFTMKMPEWFINLDGEEKARLAKKMAEESPDAHTLSDEELIDLMSSSSG